MYSPSGKKMPGFIDLYKENCFILEAKQGGVSGGKVGTAKRGTETYRKAMQGAFNQAVAYARTFKNPPPFLITCDIGESFQVWSDFGAASELDYGSYDARQDIPFADLVKPEVRALFVDIFTDPQRRNPEKIAAQVTREVAADLAELARSLEGEGRDPKLVADFLMRCIFTMFAEDVGLLGKEKIFTENLERWQLNPHKFQAGIEALWAAMNEGKPFWDYGRLLKFNGGLFEDSSAIPLDGDQLATLLKAAKRDWQKVEPAIFGTLLERALDTKERSKLGAHYTPRAYVERLVRPVVLEPLRERWRLMQIAVDRALMEEGDEPTSKSRDRAILELESFLKELRDIKVLDPACGTGNFLYVTMDLMKELESEVLKRLAEVSGRDQLRLDFEQVNPSQFLGIEINPRAAAIADLVVWIGYLQWHFRRFGDVPPIEPVLRAYHNIECRDAVLAYDGVVPDVDEKTGQVRTRWGGRTMIHPVTGKEVPDPSDQKVIERYINPRPAEWTQTDYIVSNPPFLGNRDMRDELGDGYVEALSKAYPELPNTLDYVMYWWHRSAQCIARNRSCSFGLITTNTIRQSRQRTVIDLHQNGKHGVKIFFAIPDHPWSHEGAAVRISMSAGCSKMELPRTCTLSKVIDEDKSQTPESEAESIKIQSIKVLEISNDLSQNIGISSAISLASNFDICSPGVKPCGPGFTVDQESIEFFPESEATIVRPYMNGNDLTKKSRKAHIIDCYEMSEKDLQDDYPTVYQWLLENVYPKRAVERDLRLRREWWSFERPRPELRRAIQQLKKYIATVQTSKHRVFVFLDSNTIPDQQIVAITLEDAYFLGTLSSRIHVTWVLAAGGTLEDRPRYNKTVCFDPFPFPDPDETLKQEIRDLGERLDSHRKRVQNTHPDITITGMYNLLEKIRNHQPLSDKDHEFNNRALISTLKQIHDDLDRAVFRAYGWDDLIPQWETRADTLDEQILERLVKLNAERAEEERNGHIRWLRPDYQAPTQTTTQQTDLAIVLPTPDQTKGSSPLPPSDRPLSLPKEFKARVAAVRDLFRTEGGEWTIERTLNRFSGKNTKVKEKHIKQAIEALEGAGLLLAYEDPATGEKHWYDASLQAIA
ncbi:MAG: class I SAM-dependent DNA methyltransferase [Cyanobacteria bacterium]|nr:class I SAM-dependent DNA methyltransferase [Cyanobacteriota bacterium]